MGSIGSKTATTTLPDYFDGMLGERNDEASIDRLARLNQYNLINPNYDPHNYNREYHMNCALCVVAVALQAMGYDVEAMPRDTTWRGWRDILEPDFSNPDNYMLSSGAAYHLGYPEVHGKGEKSWMSYKNSTTNQIEVVKNPPTAVRGAARTADIIEEKVKKWGNGAVGELSVSWANRNSSHGISVINQNGRVLVYDAQCNKAYPLKAYMTRQGHQIIATQTELVRLDNAKVKDPATLRRNGIDKMVKFSEKSKNLTSFHKKNKI